MRQFILTLVYVMAVSMNESDSCDVSLSSQRNLVDIGSPVTLTCQVCNTTTFANFKHNSSLIGYYIHGIATVTNASLYQIQYRYDSGSLKIALTIINFTDLSVGNYSCYIPYSNDSSLPLILSKTVPVTFVTLTPTQAKISVLPNVVVNYIKCVSSEGRPTPVITWYSDNKTPLDNTDDVNITEKSTSEITEHVTKSTLTFAPTLHDHGSSIYCKASNGYRQISSNAASIDVLVFPSKPMVLYKSMIVWNTISLIQNSTVSLECNSSGNPIPIISWILSNGSVINNRAIEMKWDNKVNTDTVSCSVTSSMQPTNGTTIEYHNTTSLLISILYSPFTPACTIENSLLTSNSIRAVKDDLLTLNCTSKSNPSPTSYTWTLPGGMTKNGPQLTIPSVISSGTYKLDVKNVMNPTFEPQVFTGHANLILTLDMLYPVAVRSIENTTVLFNHTLTVTCPYTTGNPPNTSFTWIHVNTSRVVGDKDRLMLQKMNFTDEGFYKCRVNNTMEPTRCCPRTAYDETTFFVDVQTAAHITRFYVAEFENVPNITINENQTVTLICEAESDPVAYMLLTKKIQIEKEFQSGKYSNTIAASIPNARCEYDMGIYQCKGNNTHNVVQQVREIEIKIKCAPRSSPFLPTKTHIWTKTNSSVVLTYTIVAYPPPSSTSAFVWRKQVNGEWLLINDSSNIHIYISEDRLQTNLSVFQVHVDDLANYTVKVYNDIGSTEQTFVIQANEEPAIPEHFRVSEDPVTDNTVIVEWQPGFNGGENQWFVIGYKQETGKNWTYNAIFEHITRIVIEGLVAGTSYQFKMYAENSVGRSDETIVLTLATRAKADNGSSSPVGAAVGGVVGGSLVIVICIVLWKCRNTFTFKRNPEVGAPYDDLFKGQTNVSAVNTSSEYEECRVESQQWNQYETLAETSFHVHSVKSSGGPEGISVLNRESEASDNYCAVVREDKFYVNLVL